MRVAVAFVVLVGSAAACLSCAGPSGPAANADADAFVGDTASGTEVGLDSTEALADSRPDLGVSDWPGFRRLTELPGDCVVDIAIEPSKVMPAWKWIPCTNGKKDCEEFATTWGDGMSEPFRSFQVGRATDGSLRYLKFTRFFTDLIWEHDFFDSTGRAVAAIRLQSVPTSPCRITTQLGDARMGISVIPGDRGLYFAEGPVESFADGTRALSFKEIVAAKDPTFVVDEVMSDSTLVLVRPTSIVARYPFPDGPLQKTATSSLNVDFVEGNDAFAINEYGADGWPRWFVVNDSGAKVVLAKPNRAIVSVASDSKVLVWNEYFGAGVSMPQPNHEMWSAPYSNVASVLASTGRKVANIPSARVVGGAITFNGYTVFTRSDQNLFVFRNSDGAMQTLNVGDPWTTASAIYVSDTEVWSWVTNGFVKTGFVRLKLGAWP